VFAAQSGQVIGPLDSKLAGFVVARIGEIQPGTAPPYELIRSELRTELQEAKGMHNVNVSELRWELEEEKRKHEEDFMELCTDLQAVNSANEGRIIGMTEEIKDLKRVM
jgi:hypothetical protein